MAVQEKLDMHLMDVVTTYLYGSLDNEIFMKVPEGFKVPEAYKNFRETCSIKLQKSLYGLKQSGRMWYNRLSKYLLKEGYKNDPICPCVFIKRSGSEFVIIHVEVEDLGITRSSGGLQIKYMKDGIFVHQSAYTKKILKLFYMDKTHPFRLHENNEELRCTNVSF